MTPIFITDDMTVAELRRILGPAGYHLPMDGAGRLVLTRVPPFLMRDTQTETNVVRLKRRAK